MLEQTRNFFRRNRTNIAIGASLAGAGYLAVQYVGSKLSEAHNRMMVDRVAREKFQLFIHRRFQQNQEDCSFTIQALIVTATEHIVKELPVECLTQELQRKKAVRIARSVGQSADTCSDVPTSPILMNTGHLEDDTQSLKSFASESFSAARENAEISKKSKIQLWEEIKITSLTRSFTLIYTLALLTLLTRVQLNLLGRKNYLSSVLSLAERDSEPTIRLESHEDNPLTPKGVDLETNRQYLTFSWWLLHRGWRTLMQKVDAATKEVFGPLAPRDSISLAKFRDLTSKFRTLVESPSQEHVTSIPQGSPWLLYLLPPHEEEIEVLKQSQIVSSDCVNDPSPSLRKLLDETSDLIDSPVASNVLAHMITVAFDILIDEKLGSAVFRSEKASIATVNLSQRPEVNDSEEKSTAKFASILAALARQAHVIGNGSSNEYLKVMESETQLEGFSALVYSSNFEFASWFGEEDKTHQ